ncbi:MAG: hypothetical protein HFE49_09675 [Clostridia bacterium]|nr:hypothetical protein [Clostridia bacterium]
MVFKISKYISIAFIIFLLTSCNYINENEIISNYENNKLDITTVADFFEKSIYSQIYISLSSWDGKTMFAGVQYGNVDINNSDILNSINKIKECGYEIILKTNDVIYFQDYSTKDYGYGVAYSLNGRISDNENIEVLSQIHESNWYYYKEH